MTEFISTSWVTTLLALYMLAFGAYAASQQPDLEKRKSLFRVYSIGIIVAMALVIYNLAIAR